MFPFQYAVAVWIAAFSSSITGAPLTAPGDGPQCCALQSVDPEYCMGTANNATLLDQYVCGDWRLGPVMLPTTLPPLATLLELYNRFGGLCPGDFLAKWWNATGPRGSWIYPEQTGFSLDQSAGEPPEGRAIDGNLILPVGTLIDRFGAEKNGMYFSPAAAPYLQRALPPSNLDTPQDDPQYPYNYHVYRTLQPITVLAGPIAPWFGQRGQGVQCTWALVKVSNAQITKDVLPSLIYFVNRLSLGTHSFPSYG
ncbi:hypothetical protein N0V93_007109 [Gnomoniopsis smithogilvyi]|uniref:TNT domain-containing protein n=1 Tax=Gnomoniopsis smithogilvyi TaxID=1191159 RepID=A0A9W8YPG1_9PEZI|nr:hypothetical protein N0V93_007109 [Gnomoniopsis smithogilvyi]